MELYIQIFVSTVAIAFGLPHLILFIYNKNLKANFYFALFLLLYSLNTFFDYQTSLTTSVYNEYISEEFIDLYSLIHRYSHYYLFTHYLIINYQNNSGSFQLD